MTRKVPESAVELIRKYEGFRAKPYYCSAEELTIGYGHVILPGERFKIPMTKDYAEDLLTMDIEQRAKVIDELLKVHVSDSQFGALVSFAFNIGLGAFKQSTMLKMLNDGKYTEAAGQFKRWIYADKKELAGLVKRRTAEKNLFLSGTEGNA